MYSYRPTRFAQRGISVWGWMILAVVGGFILTIAFTLAPVYVDNYAVQSTVRALATEPELAGKSVAEMRSAIERKFDVNRIEAVQAVCRDKKRACMKIEKSTTAVTIDANYEKRVHVMFNVDAVVVFSDNVVEIPLGGGR